MDTSKVQELNVRGTLIVATDGAYGKYLFVRGYETMSSDLALKAFAEDYPEGRPVAVTRTDNIGNGPILYETKPPTPHHTAAEAEWDGSW